MSNTCDCNCGSGDDETARIPKNLAIESELRDYILSELDEEDDDTFLKHIEITPEKFEVKYRTYD